MNAATRHIPNLSILGGSSVVNESTDTRELNLEELALVAGGVTTGSTK
jgi:hypothetical protein